MFNFIKNIFKARGSKHKVKVGDIFWAKASPVQIKIVGVATDGSYVGYSYQSYPGVKFEKFDENGYSMSMSTSYLFSAFFKVEQDSE